MAKMGRPKKELNWDEFEKLCKLHCTEEEIAGWFDCCVDTLVTKIKEEYGCTFSDIYKVYKGKGKSSLRKTMWSVALSGNVKMLIWLSKQHLGMFDKIHETGDTTITITHKIVDKAKDGTDDRT